MILSDRVLREQEHDRHLIEIGVESAWGWTTVAGRLRASRRAALIAKAGGLGPGLRVLEVGCGTGIFTEQFAASGAEIVAVDVSEELIEVARSRRYPPGRVEFICGQFEAFQTARRFDAIIGSSVLHHLELDAALRAMRRLLQPGGVIAFAEPNLLNPQVFVERRFRTWFPYVSPDETAFVRWSLARRLQRSGFAHISISPFDWLHPRTWTAIIPAVSSVGQSLERMPGVREFSGSLLITGRAPTSNAT